MRVKRADAVRRELVALGAQRYARDVQVEGFGKVLPVACNDTELGRQKNRRVEVIRAGTPRSCASAPSNAGAYEILPVTALAMRVLVRLCACALDCGAGHCTLPSK